MGKTYDNIYEFERRVGRELLLKKYADSLTLEDTIKVLNNLTQRIIDDIDNNSELGLSDVLPADMEAPSDETGSLV